MRFALLLLVVVLSGCSGGTSSVESPEGSRGEAVAPTVTSSNAGYEGALLDFWADASAAAQQGALSAALWEIATAYPGSLDSAKSEKCARARAADGTLGSIVSFSGDFSSVSSDPEFGIGSGALADELALYPPLAGEVFSMLVTLTSNNGAGFTKTFTDRVHFAFLDGSIYRFPNGFCR
jgi:hypothetical protein